MKHRHRVHGLILISPICTAPCWTEWLYNKVVFLNERTIMIVFWFIGIILLTDFPYAGDVKFALFLWHVWGSEGVVAEAVFQ